jgi:cation diffusion facilitator family transporter
VRRGVELLSPTQCDPRVLVSAAPAESARDQSFASVATALAANTTIAAAKGIAAALTGSPALLAETLHTLADAGNEVLLWIALRRSRRSPDATHPLGYGPERYYWALLAAVGMFVVGGTVSVWEGVNALIKPPPLETFWVGVAVLVIALVLDSVSRAVALRQLRAQAAERGVTVRQLLRETPDPTVVTVYLEDSIDVLGAALALVALVLHEMTGSAVPDALATIVIGLMLGYVAVRLTGRNRQLLSNQAIPDRYMVQLRDRLSATAGVESVARLEAVYLGPGEVLVAADIRMDPDLAGNDITAVLARIRRDAARDLPVIARLYLTPVPSDRSSPTG